MSKREEEKLKAGFFMSIGLLSTIHLHSKWGFGWVLSLTMGFVFVSVLWRGIAWTIKNTFRK